MRIKKIIIIINLILFSTLVYSINDTMEDAKALILNKYHLSSIGEVINQRFFKMNAEKEKFYIFRFFNHR